VLVFAAGGSNIRAEHRGRTLVVTTTNDPIENRINVYDADTHALLQSLSTHGKGGVGGNARGIKQYNGELVAAVNNGSNTVAVFRRDGDALTFTKASGPLFMTVTTTNNTTGNVHLAPGFADAGTYTVSVQASDGKGGTDTKSFLITVNPVNRKPTANPDGPYNGVVGVPVNFNGSGSSDPDGDTLTYAWDFGDGSTGTGAMPSHAYTATGIYTVSLTVTDSGVSGLPKLSDTATTTATISNELPANVFDPNNRIVKFKKGNKKYSYQIEPVNGSYNNSDVILASIVMKYGTRQAPADVQRTVVNSDLNGNGIQEITATFSENALKVLFAGLPSGNNVVNVAIEGDLTTGGRFRGTMNLTVRGPVSGSAAAASVSPNPLNPASTLYYATSKPGSVRVEMFDLQGRLVRTIVTETFMGAGDHQARIDGRGQRGEKLASGIYFVRGVTVDGVFKSTITILK